MKKEFLSILVLLVCIFCLTNYSANAQKNSVSEQMQHPEASFANFATDENVYNLIVEKYDYFIKYSDKNHPPLVAYTSFKNKNYQNAIDCLSEYMQSIKGPDVYIIRGAAYLMLGQKDKALEDVVIASNMTSDNFPYYLKLIIDYRFAETLAVVDDLNIIRQKQDILDKVMTKEEIDSYINYFYLQVPLSQQMSGEKRKCDAFYGENLDIDFCRAMDYDSEEKALSYIDEMKKNHSERISVIQYYTAIYYYHFKNETREQSEKVIEEISKAIELDKHNYYLYIMRGFVYRNIEKYDESLSDANTAVAINPNLRIGYELRANIRDIKNDNLGAKEDLEKALTFPEEESSGYTNQQLQMLINYLTAIDVTVDIKERQAAMKKYLSAYIFDNTIVSHVIDYIDWKNQKGDFAPSFVKIVSETDYFKYITYEGKAIAIYTNFYLDVEDETYMKRFYTFCKRYSEEKRPIYSVNPKILEILIRDNSISDDDLYNEYLKVAKANCHPFRALMKDVIRNLGGG